MSELRMSKTLADDPLMRETVSGNPRVFRYGRGDQAHWPNVTDDDVAAAIAAADVIRRDVNRPTARRQAARAFLRMHGR